MERNTTPLHCLKAQPTQCIKRSSRLSKCGDYCASRYTSSCPCRQKGEDYKLVIANKTTDPIMYLQITTYIIWFRSTSSDPWWYSAASQPGREGQQNNGRHSRELCFGETTCIFRPIWPGPDLQILHDSKPRTNHRRHWSADHGMEIVVAVNSAILKVTYEQVVG